MEDCELLNKFKTLPFLVEELGNKNGYDFTGYRKMYACKKQIRIVYSVINDLLLVPIIAIGKRPHLTALTKRRRTLVLSKYVC